jgi:branched-chain amino acid transport system substrate-binding protein
MRRVAPAVLAVVAALPAPGPAGAASLPADQTFVSVTGAVTLRTQSEDRARVTARTRCGRVTGQPVQIMGGRVVSPGRPRMRISGLVLSPSSARLTVRQGNCVATYTLRRGRRPVNVYSSLPLQGFSEVQAKAVERGIRLAFGQAGYRAGGLTVSYTSLDDSTAQAGAWDPAQVGANARTVAQDRDAIAYIGEFNSGASAISIPILNQAGIGQVSPSNTYPGLTEAADGVVERGEPEKYYPTGRRTYARIAPNDIVQGAALATLLKDDGCRNVAVAHDGEVYGAGLARTVARAAGRQRLRLRNTRVRTNARDYRSYAAGLRADDVDCFLFTGVTANGAVQLYRDVGAAVPGARLYGSDGVCESGLTNPRRGGIPARLARRFRCTVAALATEATPGGAQFLRDFRATYNVSNPDFYALYGYEAGKLVLDTIAAGGTTKRAFIEKLFQTRNRASVLGNYSIDENGDTTLTDYGVYKIGTDGNPRFEKTVTARTR